MQDSARRQPSRTSSWRPTGPLAREPRSILVVMLSALGDAVQVLPVLTALRRTFPGAHITWALQPGPRELVTGHPAVDELVEFHPGTPEGPRRSVGATARAVLRTAGRLRERARMLPGGRFDLLLDLQVYLKAGLLTWLTPARVKLGFDRRRARDLNWLFTNRRLPPRPYQHTQDQYFEFLTHLGVDPEPVEFALRLTAQERKAQEAFFEDLPGPACGIVLATSRPDKDWNPEGYAHLVEEVRTRWGLIPIFLGGTSRGETDMARAVQALVEWEIPDGRGGGLRRLAWLLAGSRVVVSPDTGPLHIAHALGTPVVGLYGSTNPHRHGPYGGDPRLVVDGYARFPGERYSMTTERRPEGMARIGPNDVLDAVGVALEDGGR